MTKKNIMKILSIVLVLMLSLGFVGCEKEPEEEVPTEIDTRYTDALKLEHEYQGKSFLIDGIGPATLSQNVDGDTAHFMASGTRVTIRFLNIDTPESTGRIEAWGKAASRYVAGILNEAAEIVLEASEVGKPAQLDATGRRHLGYIWYRPAVGADFRLLNLEIIEECYSQFRGVVGDHPYGTVMDAAFKKAYSTRLRIFGEQDPNFDYSTEVREVTIAEIRNNFDLYSRGTRLRITARVMRLSGDNLYLEDLDETFNEETNEYEKAGIYIFSGYGSGLAVLKIGSVIDLRCQVVENDTYGKQLTNPQNVRIVSDRDGKEVDVQTILSEVTSLEAFEGFVVRLENVLITGKGAPNDLGAYTINAQMANGSNVNIRIDGSSHPKLPWDQVIVGERYDIIGGVSKFHDNYQLIICNQTGLALNDFIKR